MAPLVDSVRALYEAHPYPHYPLLARPRWQDGYLTHAAFARNLGTTCLGEVQEGNAPGPAEGATTLIGGSGEILPYVIRHWSPAGHHVISVDLSARSLRRSRIRLLATRGPTTFHRGDLDDYLLAAAPSSLSHVDVFGVLHHMPNPGKTIAAIARALTPGGTVRLMVYNTEARAWIFQLQRLFALCGLAPLVPGDLTAGRKLLAAAGEALPALGARLRQLGAATWKNDARFADTFLHPREARLAIGTWFAHVQTAGLSVVGQLDRYGELDDLENPLWQPPPAGALQDRAGDLRFEGNLEVYLRRQTRRGSSGAQHQARARGLLPSLYTLPPSLWFSFSETRSLPFLTRQRLWHAHLSWIFRGERRFEPMIGGLPRAATQRLARLGAILPGQIADAALREALTAPMVDAMEAPEAVGAVAVPEVLEGRVRALLGERGRLTERRIHAALLRLHRSQF